MTTVIPPKDRQHLIKRYIELLIMLVKEGYSYTEVGIVLNRTRSVIQKLYDKHKK